MDRVADAAKAALVPDSSPEAASFERLMQGVEHLGSNQGRAEVIALYRDWIARQPSGRRRSEPSAPPQSPN